MKKSLVIIFTILFVASSFMSVYAAPQSNTNDSSDTASMQAYDILIGTLTTGSDTNQFILKTESGPYELWGNTKGMEECIGMTLEVQGYYIMTFAPTEFPLFNVVSYRVVKPVILQGTVCSYFGQLYIVADTQERYILLGNITGIDKYIGEKIEIVGIINGSYGVLNPPPGIMAPSLLMKNLIVISFKPIEP